MVNKQKTILTKLLRWVIIVLIFVFDPLAVLLLIAANISLRSRKVEKEEKENKIKKDYQKELTQKRSEKSQR